MARHYTIKPDQTRCKGTTADGEPCQAFVPPVGSGLCRHHDPAQQERQATNRARLREARARVKAEAKNKAPEPPPTPAPAPTLALALVPAPAPAPAPAPVKPAAPPAQPSAGPPPTGDDGQPQRHQPPQSKRELVAMLARTAIKVEAGELSHLEGQSIAAVGRVLHRVLQSDEPEAGGDEVSKMTAEELEAEFSRLAGKGNSKPDSEPNPVEAGEPHAN